MLTRLELEQKAAAMRQAPTTCESRALDSLWSVTRPERQVVFGFYILDFVVPERLLVIEIDGESHAGQREHDARRDAFCADLGLRVLRIPNALAHRAALELARFPEVEGWEKVWRKAQRRAGGKQARIETKQATPPAERRQAISRDKQWRQARRVLQVLQVQGRGGTPLAQEQRAIIAEFGPPPVPRKTKKPYTPPEKKKTPQERAVSRAAKKARRKGRQEAAAAASLQVWTAAVVAATAW